jgi:hypothetical protein
MSHFCILFLALARTTLHSPTLFKLFAPVFAVLMVEISSADAVVLCAKANGQVFVRTECKKNETQLDPVVLGLVGIPTPCPEGLVRAPDTQGFCIEQSARPADTYLNATRTCTLEGLHLCEASQWIGTCAAAADLDITDISGQGEWIATIGGVADSQGTAGAWIMGGGAAGYASFGGGGNVLTDLRPYRCCTF